MLGKESKPEEFYLGASHADKIGKIVILDISSDADRGGKRVATVGIRGGLMGPRTDRVILSGVLHGTEDSYEDNGDVKSTSLIIGEVTAVIDWSDEPVVVVSVMEGE